MEERVLLVRDVEADVPGDEETGESDADSTGEESASAQAEETGLVAELTVKQIWDAPKGQLRDWCQQLGLDDTGPIMNLRLRLLSRIESG